MISMMKAKALINDLFEEEALAIGGLVAAHGMDEDVVWRLVECLEAARDKVLDRLADHGPSGDDEPLRTRSEGEPHPAIEYFLMSLREA
jgi:hypothetical protein